jgi:hypothetical protein
MVLTVQEESLISVFRTLPPGEAMKILAWARHLAEFGAGGPVEWSDSWTGQDCEDASKASMEGWEAMTKEGT